MHKKNKLHYLEFLVLFIHLDPQTNWSKINVSKLIRKIQEPRQVRRSTVLSVYLPARTAVPTQESTPERKELNGNVPTKAM